MKTDSEIQKDVMDELRWDPILTASEIGVAVKKGIVTLSGTVNTYAKKIAAEEAAKRVAGVKAVAEDMEVKVSGSGKKNDTEIAEAVLNELKWHSSVDADKIKIKVEDGWVTMEGEIDWEFQRRAIHNVVENLLGVSGIIDNIKVIPTLRSKDIKQKINAAFHRSATIDSDKIHIDTSGSKVILKGKVRSWAEKKDAENAAWLAPGVSAVENQIEIDTEVFAY